MFIRQTIAIGGLACTLAAVPFGLATSVQSERWEIAEGEATFRTWVRMEAKAATLQTILNPLDHPQVDWIISDGAYVTSGAVITAFSPELVEEQLEDSRYDSAILSAEIAKEAATEQDQDLARRDKLAELEDTRAVLETRRARLQALPEPGEVRIAEGQLRIAEQEAAAAARELEKGQGRFERGMISQAALDDLAFDMEEWEASVVRARETLAYRRQPAEPKELERVALQIANVELDIKRVMHEIAQNRKIQELQRQGTEAQRRNARRRIREASEAIDKLEVKAPRDGYIIYKRELRERYLEGGRKMHRNYGFLSMPDSDVLQLRGSIREAERQWLRVGDAALVHVAAHGGGSAGGVPVVTGRVAEISVLARDQAERDQQQWGEEKETGVKVYDVIVELERIPEWLRLGMHADVVLVAQTPAHGVVVPAGFVQVRDDGYYLGVEGVLEQVEGRLMGDLFMLKDDRLLGRTATLFAREPEERVSDEEALPGVRALGELVPTDVEPVRVGAIYRWQKLVWVVPENTEVAAGDLLARLDDEQTRDEFRDAQSKLDSARSMTESQREQDKLSKQLSAWSLEEARNKERMAWLTWTEMRDRRNELGLISARYKVRRAEIALARVTREYERSAAKGHRLLSPLALRRLERDVARARLALEAAQIALAESERGPLPVELGRQECQYQDMRRAAADMERRQAYEDFARACGAAKVERAEARAERRLADVEKALESLEIYAPRAGIVRYGKVWDGAGISKIKPGATVGRRVRIMDIAAVAGMEVRVGVPERYYRAVSEGMAVRVALPSLGGTVLDGVVEEVEFLFEDRRRKDTTGGIYSTQEHLGRTEFFVRVRVTGSGDVALKPGMMADVIFPFNGEAGR